MTKATVTDKGRRPEARTTPLDPHILHDAAGGWRAAATGTAGRPWRVQEGAWPGGGRAAGLDAAAGIGARRSAGWRAERPWPGPQRGRADERGARRLCPGAQRPGGRVRAASRLGAVLAGAKAEGRRCVRARRRRLAMEVRSNGLLQAGWSGRQLRFPVHTSGWLPASDDKGCPLQGKKEFMATARCRNAGPEGRRGSGHHHTDELASERCCRRNRRADGIAPPGACAGGHRALCRLMDYFFLSGEDYVLITC
ncbi:uncharacterized protein LOC119320938 [Triticum dicoccoides]|uniref:uncharacterized protein LOC119320938 n=1 Tax=Triticum dicoccoides TaxID=85692 RepID=UPI0018910AFA|nr:uncharacterized protein LOC119320938 [Triticum dicoccoides]